MTKPDTFSNMILEDDMKDIEANAPYKVYHIDGSEADLWQKRGLISEPVWAESGERLELHWRGFFPHYELYFFKVGDEKGQMIGRCHFMGGCNKGFYVAPDKNNNRIPDYFVKVQWESMEYNGGSSVKGHIDRYRYVFLPSLNRLVLYYDLLDYACNPSEAVRDEPSPSKTTCEPPCLTIERDGSEHFKVYSTKVIKVRELD